MPTRCSFEEAWYSSVGTALTLTMLFNVALPHAGPVVSAVLASSRRCSDRGCTRDVHRTKQLTQQELNALYLGPEVGGVHAMGRS